jgi:threonyl-tRNA synthetase
MLPMYAEAVKKLWPETKLAIGRLLRTVFTMILTKTNHCSSEDLAKIEQEMQRIIDRDEKFYARRIEQGPGYRIVQENEEITRSS